MKRVSRERCRRYRSGVDQRLADGVDAEVEPLERPRAEEDEVARFSEHYVVSGGGAAGIDERRFSISTSIRKVPISSDTIAPDERAQRDSNPQPSDPKSDALSN
jgi:hypothetical protein